MKLKLALRRRKMPGVFLFAMFLLLSGAIDAQTRRVSGRVTGADEKPLQGVSVMIKGTSIGTTTDATGTFAIDAAQTDSITFGYVGFADQTVSAAGAGNLSISMTSSAAQLNEVVVIGYQTIRRRDLTGATAVINAGQAQRNAPNSVADQIQGMAPGVTVRTTGAPGVNPRVEIRGVSSFNNADPLYVIDGMIADANSTINPNDIESIQVLKDASAAAIYGSRAANGVIIVTTKQGREGAPKVSLSTRYGVQQLPKRWDVMDANEFAAMQRQQYTNSGIAPLASVAGTPKFNTDWQNEILRNGTIADYGVSLSGGSRTSTYLISAGYFKNQGVLLFNDFDRASLRINSRTTKGRVTFGQNLSITQSRQEAPNEGNPFYDMAVFLPVIPVKDASYVDPSQAGDNPMGFGVGTNDAITYAWNPVAVGELTRRKSSFSKLVGNAYIDVKLTDWLSYRFNAGAEVSFDTHKTLRKQGRWQFVQSYVNANVFEDRQRYLSLLFEHTLNFNKTFGKHALNGVIGFSDQQFKREGNQSGRNGLQQINGEYFTTINSASGTDIAFGGIFQDSRIHGYLGRLNYSYNDKYLLSLTGRADQDSRFSKNFRTGFFPAAAVSWRINKEDFFNVSWISDLKLRASYGKLGINTIGDWQNVGLLNNSPRVVFGANQQVYVGATQARLFNPDLRWESRTVQNFGFDASFLKNRFSLSAEYYNSKSTDVLFGQPIAIFTGNLAGNPQVNAASIQNRGVEIVATYRDNRNAFKYDVSVNATTIQNKVLSVGNQGQGIDYIQTGLTRSQVGQPIGQWYLLNAMGLFQSQAEIDAYRSKNGTLIQPFAKPGDVKYEDVNGDGLITDDGDRKFIGSPWPKLQAGAQLNASYKGFTFNMQLVGVFGYQLYNDVYRILKSYQHSNFLRGTSPWTPTNTNTEDARLGLGTNDVGITDNIRGSSNRWLSDAGYLRVRNIELGYNIRAPFLERANISNARVFINAQNLFTITKYNGLDPDATGDGILDRGFDRANWPASRMFSIGLNCDF